MTNTIMQQYMTTTSQGVFYRYYPHTEDKEQIKLNIKEVEHQYIVLDFGLIEETLVQDFSGFCDEDGSSLYERHIVRFTPKDFNPNLLSGECEIVKKDGQFYGMYYDGGYDEVFFLMTDEYTYETVIYDEESDDDYWWMDEYACENFCCPCCGCTCYWGDDEDTEEENDEPEEN